MAADTYDPILGLILQGTGNNNNAWGLINNNSMIKLTARAIAGLASLNVTGGTLDLSGSPPPATARQDLDYIQFVQGTLGSHQTIIVPNLTKTWLFYNNTSGAFQVFVKTPSGTAVQVPQGTARVLYCIGSNIIKRADEEEIGAFRVSGKAAAGPGELICSGQSLLRADFPDLFAKIGGTWGAVDGTHFTLPDFTSSSRFLRASGAAGGVGTYQSSQNLSHSHTGSGTSSTVSNDHTHAFSWSGTSGAADRDLNHLHSNANACQNVSSTGGGQFATGYNTNVATGATDRSIDHLHGYSGSSGTGGISANHTHTYSFTTSGGSADGAEARPICAVVLVCIKF